MRIAIIGSRGYPYVYSGYETFVRELGERLAARGEEVTVYCHRGLFRERPGRLNGIRLVYLPTIERKNLSQFVHSLQAMVHACFCRYDVILAVNSANGPFGLLTRLCGRRTVINVDGLEWLRPKWRGLGARYFRWASRQATRRFDRVVTDSLEMQKIYAREFGAASTMIAYGANIDPAAAPALLAPWALEPQGYYLVVGRLVPDNNADLIVREFAASGSKRRLVIVGDVPYRDAYAEGVHGRGRAAGVLFTGYVTHAGQLAALYQHCYAYVHGHEFGGTNPSLLHALANGCAVLALDTAFSREVLGEGEHGLFFNKKEGSLGRLFAAADDGLLAGLRAGARRRVEESYSWEKVTSQYLELFAELVDGKSPRR